MIKKIDVDSKNKTKKKHIIIKVEEKRSKETLKVWVGREMLAQTPGVIRVW